MQVQMEFDEATHSFRTAIHIKNQRVSICLRNKFSLYMSSERSGKQRMCRSARTPIIFL